MTDGSDRSGDPSSASPASPGFDSAVATGKGDDGTTGLLFGGERIRKDDLRTEAYGTIDEAVAALGVARRRDVKAPTRERHRPRRRDHPATPARAVRRGGRARDEPRRLGSPGRGSHPGLRGDGRRRWTSELRELEGQSSCRHEFVVPGETALSAALELARTILRRAERRAVSLEADGLVPGDHLLPYLNRLADLLWVLARAAEQAETRAAHPSPAPRSGPDRSTRSHRRHDQRADPDALRVACSCRASSRTPALARRFLTQAFAWMFVGLLLTAAVAFVVQAATSLRSSPADPTLHHHRPDRDRRRHHRARSAKISATAALGLFFVYAASVGLTVGLIVAYYTRRSVATAFLERVGDVRRRGDLRRDDQALAGGPGRHPDRWA